MDYRPELDFLMKTLRKMHLQVLLLPLDGDGDMECDFGLRKFLGREEEYEQSFLSRARRTKENTIYKLRDPYLSHYIYLCLPEVEKPTALIIGPYTTLRLNRQRIMEEAEKLGIPAARFRQFEGYYANVPVMEDTATLFMILNTFAERIWGEGTAYEIVDIDQDTVPTPVSRPVRAENGEEEDILLRMKIMETRYAYENELMETVSKGLVHRAEMMVAGNQEIGFEQRAADPLRNLKNYAIICNTLMRKAAERGGVHPVYLDSISSEFAKEIEALNTTSGGTDILRKMVRSYCRLVKKHASKHYSTPVEKAVTSIEADISGDLSLQALAKQQGINPSYLSTLFKKETGQTLTDYVNQRRVDHARHLLSTTKLQVQTVSQHCGISDVNYFSKTFKKYVGKTPLEYRRATQRGE